jgi:hypothetical protein
MRSVAKAGMTRRSINKSTEALIRIALKLTLVSNLGGVDWLIRAESGLYADNCRTERSMIPSTPVMSC